MLDLLSPVLDDTDLPEGTEPRFNVAPTQLVPIVANRSTRAVELARWGLVPPWAEDLSIGNRLINARGETMAGKRAFRDAFARRRCLVPADGFYEWQRAGKKKQPYFIHQEARRPFALAGLWERWRSPDGAWLISFTIVTCASNALLSPIHDRMPVIVAPEDFERWLARDPVEPDALADILAPADPAGWAADAVGDAVNRPTHDGPDCVESVPAQGLLL
jgi:putative SOS response-associated peptidase YedK